MNVLSARQTLILKTLIDEYIETAGPVGSDSLEKKYNLGVSPATIRNEMVQLTKNGFLRQPHTSSGRVPTPLAMKFYVDQLMEEKQLSLADEVGAKEDVWDSRKDFIRFMNNATHSLAERSKAMAVSATDDGLFWKAGEANIFSYPEFENLSICANLFGFIDEKDSLIDLFFKRFPLENPFDVLFVEELGFKDLPVSVVAAHLKIKDKDGALGIVGPIRQSYSDLVPMIKYYKNMLEEIINS